MVMAIAALQGGRRGRRPPRGWTGCYGPASPGWSPGRGRGPTLAPLGAAGRKNGWPLADATPHGMRRLLAGSG